MIREAKHCLALRVNERHGFAMKVIRALILRSKVLPKANLCPDDFKDSQRSRRSATYKRVVFEIKNSFL
jgi:hypothetical protein